MTDYHSHILPGIDDGSPSVEESILMLRALAEQGVDTVYATPHFDAAADTPAEFFARRAAAYEKLTAAVEGMGLPRVLLGAEVAYFSGIAQLQELADFLLEDTRILLLEMPIDRWSEFAVGELVKLALRTRVQLCLAHVERYRSLQKRAVWQRLLELRVLMQVNASYFASPKTRRAALKELKKGEIHLLGSDTHNMKSRPPRMGEALAAIRDAFGDTHLINRI